DVLRLRRGRDRVLRRPHRRQLEGLLDRPPARLRARRPRAHAGAARRLRGRVRAGQDLPSVPRRAVLGGQDAVQDPLRGDGGRLLRPGRPRRADGGGRLLPHGARPGHPLPRRRGRRAPRRGPAAPRGRGGGRGADGRRGAAPHPAAGCRPRPPAAGPAAPQGSLRLAAVAARRRAARPARPAPGRHRVAGGPPAHRVAGRPRGPVRAAPAL
ncbi:MAG: hypothetical protein AVDCRST_MAG66-3745, partial [uncultured Pseudonocardia sp.]